MVWARSGLAFYATLSTVEGNVCFRRTVEELPTGSSDWAVWRPGEAPEVAMSGIAATVQEAMRYAELATLWRQNR